MDPNQHYPSPSSHAGVNISQGSSAEEFYSFCSSLDRSRGVEDVTLQQLATAKETFTDLEVAYKNFKHEMEIVKEEHRREVGKLNAQIENQAKQKICLEEQLRSCKSEARKHQEELIVLKRNLAERDWEKETISRELASHNTLIDKLRGEREVLEGTIASLNQEIATSRMPASTPPDRTGEDNKELALARQEMAKWEANYKYALKEKEGLQAEIVDMQNKLADMQTNCEKMQRELHFSNKASNMKVSKLEVQIQNLTKERDYTRNQLDEAKEEQRKSKEALSFLQRDVIDAEQKAENFREELNLKSKQIEKLESVNRSQEMKVEEVRQECSRQQASIEMYSRQRSSFDSDIRAFESNISELENSLQMAKNEKNDVHRELYSSTSKLTTIQESYQKARERSNELEQHVTNLKEGVAQLESDLLNERSNSFHIESAYNQLRVEVDELSVKLEKANSKITALESDYDACLHERDDYKDTSSLSERKILELKNLLQKSEDANNELDERFSTIKGQTWKLEGQFESATKQKKQLKVELDEERSKVSKLNKELLAAQSRYSEYQRSVEWHKRDTASKDKVIEDLRMSLSSAEQRIESFYEEIDRLQAKIEAVEDEKRELHEETLSAQKRTKEVEAGYVLIADEKEKLNSEVQAFYKRISEMQTSYNTCEREKHDFQRQGMALQHKVNKLEEDLQESVKRISSFELQVQELSSENRKSGETAAMYKCQSAEQQGTCEELKKLGIEREALIEQLREKTAVLHAEVGSYRTELSHYKSLCEDFEQEKKSMQNQLKSKQDEWFRLNATYEANLKKREQLEYELSVAQKKVASLEAHSRKSQDTGNKRELDLERAKAAGLEKELSSLKMKFKLIESQSEVNQRDLHGVLEEIEQAEEKISSLSLDMERITAEKNEESQRALSVENKCSELENEVWTCLRSKEKAEEDVLIMGTRIAKYESQIETLQKQKASMKEQLDIVNNDLTKQKEEIMCWESKVIESKKVKETLNSVIFKKESLIQELQMNIGNMETDLKTLRQEMISLKVNCEGMKADKTEGEQRISSCQDKVKGYEQELNNLQETRMALEQEINTAKFRTTTLERQLKVALKDKEHYKSEYHNFQTTVRNVKEETLTLHNQLREKERRCEAYAADMNEKESELEKMRSNNVVLKSELLEVREDLETMRYNFENSQHLVQELEASLSEANDSISKLDLSIENLHQERSETSGDVSEDKYFEMEALLRKSQEKEQSLKQDITTFKTRIGEMGTKLKSEQHRNIELTQEINTLQRKIHDSETILERYEREKRTLKEELMLANSTASDLEVKYDYESREREAIEKQLQETRGRTATNREKLLKTEQQVLEQRLALEFSQRELEERDNLTSQLQASKKILEEQTASMQESLVESREMCERMKGEQGKLQRDILDQCSAIADAEARVQKISLERDRILTESHSCMSKISSLEQQVVEMGREKEQLLSRLDEWKQSCSKHREGAVNSQNKIAEFETKIDSLLAQIAKKDSLVQELNDENAFMGKEIESLRRSLKRIEGDYNSAMERKREIESQCRSMAETRLSVTSDECDQLEKDVSVLRRHVAELEVDYKASREKEEELQQNLVVANSEAAKWESQYSAVADQKVKLEHEMSTLQKEYVSIKESQQKSLWQVESLQEDIQECSNRIVQRDTQVGQLTRAKVLLERQLQQKDALLTTWENELLQAQRKLQEFQILEEHKNKEKESEETVLEDLNVERKALEKDAYALRQELSVFQRSLNVAMKEKSEAQKELFDLKKQITQNEIRPKSCEQENEELCKELVTSQHNGLQRDLFTAQRKASNLEYELKKTREKLDSLAVSYKASEDLVISLKEETIDLGRKSSETEASYDRNLKRSKELAYHNSVLERTLSSQGLQMKDLCHEREALVCKLIETESKSKETCSQLEKQVQTLNHENNKNKEMVENLTARIVILQKEIESLKEEMSSKDTSSSKYRAKVKKLENELKETTDKSDISINLCREKENLIYQQENQVREVNMKYDDACREKEFLIQERNNMESELRTARERISKLENRSVIEARAEKESVVLKEKHFQLEKEYDRVILERRNLEIDAEVRRKALEEKNQQINQLERKVLEMEFYKARSEELSHARETLSREKLFLEQEARLTREKALECETRLEMEKKRMENELGVLGEKYAELEGKYNELIEAKQKLEEITEIMVRSETMKKEESVFKLERHIRGLKSENEYYEKVEDKKYASMNEMRRKISRLETENEYLRKHIFIAVESYDKAEKKLKKIQSAEYQPVVTYEIRQAIREASGRNRCESLDSSTASLNLSHLSISSPRVDRAGPKLGRSPTMSSTPKPGDWNTTEAGDMQRIRRTSSPIGRNVVNTTPRRSSSLRMSKDSSEKRANSASRKPSEDSSHSYFDSVFYSPNSFNGSSSKQNGYPGAPGATKVDTAFPFGSSCSVSSSSVPWSRNSHEAEQGRQPRHSTGHQSDRKLY